MDIPLGMEVYRNRGEWVLELKKSLYGIRQASTNWVDLLKTGLERMGYHQFQFYPNCFTEKTQLFLTNADDCVIVSHKQETIT